MNFGLLWGAVFASMIIGFVVDTYALIKGIRRKRMGVFDVLMSLSLPFFILLMLVDKELTLNEKIIDSIIAFVCVVSGIVHIYVLRKKRRPDKEGTA